MFCFLSLVYFVILLNATVDAIFYRSNSTDLSKCNITYTRNGSTYKDFHQINTESNVNNSLMIDFHFAVLAASDAHILLVSSVNVTKTDPAYEIVIGAGGNTFCDIRRMQKSDVRHSVRIKGLLSPLDPRFFWIHISKDGLIEVGREGENSSFINYTDLQPLTVKLVSFSTWSGIEAKWFYGCDRSQNEEELEKNRNSMEKLRRALLIPYDPLVRPVKNQSIFSPVQISFNIESIHLNDREFTISIRGTSTMKWQDEKMIWNPKEYDNITEIFTTSLEIWTPEITTFPTLSSIYFYNSLQKRQIVVNYLGDVVWKTNLNIDTICASNNLGNWPKDIYNCSVIFGLGSEYKSVVLNYFEADSNLFGSSQDMQFLITKASVNYVESNSMSGVLSDSFQLNIEVLRNATVFSVVFFMPLLVIALCLLFSLWTTSKAQYKQFLGIVQLTLEVMMLLAIAYFIPPIKNGIPLLVTLYSLCLIGSSISIIISILASNISKRNCSKPFPYRVSKLLTNNTVQFILQLPRLVRLEDYGDIDISIPFSEGSKTEDKTQQFWILLGISIERLTFFIYLIFMSAIILKYSFACF